MTRLRKEYFKAAGWMFFKIILWAIGVGILIVIFKLIK